MKKLIQNLKNGKTELLDTPVPMPKEGCVLIKSEFSLISLGTENMLVEFGKANLLKKAKLQPDKVKKAIEKIRNDGLIPTIKTIKNKLNSPLPLGYSNSGVVIALGKNVSEFQVGDRVVSNGPHSEYFNCPLNLCEKIPKNVPSDQASFTVIASISLNGVRLLNPTLGEKFFVIGLGLIGLISAQLLVANGCEVVVGDLNQKRLNIAKKSGIEAIKLNGKNKDKSVLTNYDSSFDGVLICTNTKSNNPIDLATFLTRKNGRIVLIGTSNIEINRTDFYDKQLKFQISKSYGPGRHDTTYEDKGIDYPISEVRWTIKRNFKAILNLLSNKKLKFDHLISHKFSINEIAKNYLKFITNPNEYLGIIISYNSKTLSRKIGDNSKIKNKINYDLTGFIGAGNYAQRDLLPSFIKAGAKISSICSIDGLNATFAGRKFNIPKITSDATNLFKDKNLNNLVIATRHDSHFELICKGIKANKNIFVEKPVCLRLDELDKLKKIKFKNESNIFTVGFNRRYSPLIQVLKKHLMSENEPKFISININAGFIHDHHWIQDLKIGGGRILGEAIHFIDLIRYLFNCKISSWKSSNFIGTSLDTCSVILNGEDGSIGNINYFSNGSNEYQKENIILSVNGKMAVLDNFKSIKFYSWPQAKNKTLISQNKGNFECVLNFLQSIKNLEKPLISFNEIYEVTKIAIEIANNKSDVL